MLGFFFLQAIENLTQTMLWENKDWPIGKLKLVSTTGLEIQTRSKEPLLCISALFQWFTLFPGSLLRQDESILYHFLSPMEQKVHSRTPNPMLLCSLVLTGSFFTFDWIALARKMWGSDWCPSSSVRGAISSTWSTGLREREEVPRWHARSNLQQREETNVKKAQWKPATVELMSSKGQMLKQT